MRTLLPPHASIIPAEAKLVYHGVMYNTYQWQQELYDGTHKTFEMIKRFDTIKVLAIKDGKLIVLEEEQPGSSVYFDLPGGRNDIATDSELDCAQREIKSETGLSFHTWKLLQISQPFHEIDWFVYLFLATDVISEEKQNLDGGERISLKLLTLTEALALSTNDKARYLPYALLENVDNFEQLSSLPPPPSVNLQISSV